MCIYGRSSIPVRPLGFSLFLALTLFTSFTSEARNFRVGMLPNGNTFGCITCHSGAGGGPRNPFGLDVFAIVKGPSAVAFWSPALAALDSDGDGFTNGEELGDPDGDGVPTPGATITNPGDPTSKPNLPPTVSLTAPIEGAELPTISAITFSADAADTDDGIRSVEFFASSNGPTNSLGLITVSPYSIHKRLTAGDWKLAAKVIDNRGLARTSSVVNVKVVAPADLVANTPAPNAEKTQIDLSWQGGAGPFVVQHARHVDAIKWQNSPVTPSSTVTVPMNNDTGFYRIVDLATAGKIPLSVYLTGESELPDPVTNSATGFGLMYLDGTDLTFDVQAKALSAPAIAMHIHGPATTSESAGVLVNFAPYVVGSMAETTSISGTISLDITNRTRILNGLTYVNFHTTNYPRGEIRGQIAPVTWVAELNGASERPDPVTTEATGSAHFLLVGNELTFNISYRNLSAGAVAAHIHGPAGPDESNGVLVNFAPFVVGSFGTSGTFAGKVTLSSSTLAAFIAGRTYFNIHTPNNPRGEIRGQIVPRLTATPLTAFLDGTVESPAIPGSTASGNAIVLLEGNQVSLEASYKDLSAPAVAAHFHGPATSTNSAGVLLGIESLSAGPLSTVGGLGGVLTLTDDQKTAILNGLTYLNFHTPNNPRGEIRGQVAPVLTTATLNGANEKPTAVSTPGFGQGTFLLAHQNLAVFVSYQNLTTNASLSHIHGPSAVTGTGNVLVDLEDLNGGAFGISGTLVGFKILTPGQIGLLSDGLTYVNVHTPRNTRGEIRGQIVR